MTPQIKKNISLKVNYSGMLYTEDFDQGSVRTFPTHKNFPENLF